MIKDLSKSLNHIFKNENNKLILIGKTFGHLEQSCFLKENYSINDGMPPEINLLNEKNNGECLLKLIENNLISSSHDVSNGGLITAISEMVLSSNYGAKIHKPKKLTNLFEYFLEKIRQDILLKLSLKKCRRPKKY